MVRDEWARPRYEHRDVRAEYSWRGFRGRPRGWKRRGRWRPRFDRRRWDDDRPQGHGDSNDNYREYEQHEHDGSPYDHSQRYPENPYNGSDRHEYQISSGLPDTEMKHESGEEYESRRESRQDHEYEYDQEHPREHQQRPEHDHQHDNLHERPQEPDPIKVPESVDASSSDPTQVREPVADSISIEMAHEAFDSDATDEDLTAASAEALSIQLPPTKVESELLELYSRLPKHNLKYLSLPPLEIPTLPAPSSVVVDSIKQHRNTVAYAVQTAQTDFRISHKKWLELCASLDTHTDEPVQTQQTSQPEAPQSPRHKGGRRNRSYGDAVRSEAEFMEILANLEMETARDPLIRARLTSVMAPPQIFDPRELKAVFVDTNNLVLDKSVLLKRLELDNIDTFSEDEHTKFCDAYAQFPKQFGKISAAMGGFRTFHECVMHYYRTKKNFDYKLLVQKKKPKGKRGRKPKKPRIEALEDEKTKADDSNDTSMVIESEGQADTIETESNADTSLFVEPTPKVPPLGPSVPMEVSVMRLEPAGPVSTNSDNVGESQPETLFVVPKPRSEVVVLPEAAQVEQVEAAQQAEEVAPVVSEEADVTEEADQPDNSGAIQDEATHQSPLQTAVPDVVPHAPAETARDPDATVDEVLRAVETPIKPKPIAQPVAASTPIAPRLMPLRTPKIPKTSSIPPPVQPLVGNRKADPMHSSGIDALATVALEANMEPVVEEKLKGSKSRRRKDVSKPTSYWNAAETKKFETLLGLFGSKWDEISKHIQSKSAIMLKNHYTKHKEVKGYEEIVKKADARNAQSGTIPVYVSADPEEVPSPSTNTAEPIEIFNTAGSVPESQPVPVQNGTESVLAQMTNGPASGFFEPRQRQLPVQSFHPDDKEQDTTTPAPTVAPEVPQGLFSTPSQPPRPFVRPRTSLLASILHEGAGLPKPKSNFMEADSYKIDTVMPFLGGAPYRESNERGHNS